MDPTVTNYSLEEPQNKLLTKKNILAMLAVGILLLVIPFLVVTFGKRTIFKSRASENTVTFTGEGVNCPSGEICTTVSDTINIELRSETLGNPGTIVTSTPRP